MVEIDSTPSKPLGVLKILNFNNYNSYFQKLLLGFNKSYKDFHYFMGKFEASLDYGLGQINSQSMLNYYLTQNSRNLELGLVQGFPITYNNVDI